MKDFKTIAFNAAKVGKELAEFGKLLKAKSNLDDLHQTLQERLNLYFKGAEGTSK